MVETGTRAVAVASIVASQLVSAVACAAEAPLESQPDYASWAGLYPGVDIRAEASGLFKRYTRSSGRGLWMGGPGGGVGASASMHFRTPATPGGSFRWLDFELGVGNAQHYGSYWDGSGRSTSFFENELAMVAAVHFAIGRLLAGRGHSWSGAVLGFGWTPTWVYFVGNSDFSSIGRTNPAGLRFTIDVSRVAPRSWSGPHARFSVTWLPYVSDLPSEVVAGAGIVFY